MEAWLGDKNTSWEAEESHQIQIAQLSVQLFPIHEKDHDASWRNRYEHVAWAPTDRKSQFHVLQFSFCCCRCVIQHIHGALYGNDGATRLMSFCSVSRPLYQLNIFHDNLFNVIEKPSHAFSLNEWRIFIALFVAPDLRSFSDFCETCLLTIKSLRCFTGRLWLCVRKKKTNKTAEERNAILCAESRQTNNNKDLRSVHQQEIAFALIFRFGMWWEQKIMVSSFGALLQSAGNREAFFHLNPFVDPNPVHNETINSDSRSRSGWLCDGLMETFELMTIKAFQGQANDLHKLNFARNRERSKLIFVQVKSTKSLWTNSR